jgi:branched-chain amino acid transport system ATP-binding protein
MLEIEDASVSYGAVRAVQDVSLSVEEGQILALLGPNGAGKTSLLSAIMGIVPCAGGRVTFMGERIDGRRPETIVRRGIGLTPEGRQIFGSLTVEENLRLGATPLPQGRASASTRSEVLDLFPVLKDRLSDRAVSLSGGQQQQLAIARSLLGEPKLLMLDEPSLGLAPILVDSIFRLIVTLRDRGVTILLVEQNAMRAVEIADAACVLASGRRMFYGTPGELTSDRAILDAYFGVDQIVETTDD